MSVTSEQLSTDNMQNSETNTIAREYEQTASKESTTDSSTNKPLSKRDYDMAVRSAGVQRDLQIKQNKRMIEELNLEVAYWKAQVDLSKYRFEKMDYFLKNIELEPKYLAAVEVQKFREEQNNMSKSILS